MAVILDELVTILTFRGDAEGIRNTRTNLRGLSDDINTVAQGLGVLGGAITAVGIGALTQFVPFEDRLATIRGLVGVTNDELAEMEPRLHDIGAATGVGPQSLADALFFITSNGLRAGAAMETVERAAIAQAVGLGDAETSARLATSAINAYGEENLSATQAFDDLTAAVRLGNLETSSLAGSMGRLIPIASGLKVEFGETAGLLAALSRTGTEADEGVTQLTQIMVSLLNPSAEATSALEELGLSAGALRRHMADEGLLATLVQLRDRFGDNEDAMTAVFGNVRALRGVFDLLGPNLSVTQQIMADMADTTGELDGAFQRSETDGRNFRRMLAQLQSAAILLGDAISPVANTLLGPLTAALRQVSEWLESDSGWVRVLAQGTFILGGALLGLSAVLFGVAGALRVLAFSLAPVNALLTTQIALTTRSIFFTELLRIRMALSTATTWLLAGARTALAVVTNSLTLANARAVLGFITSRAVMIAGAIATGVMTAAQWALNVAMYANPIGLIIIGIAALIAGIIAAAYFIWRFRDAIMDGIGAAWNWIKENWPLILGILTGPFGLAAIAIIKYREQIIAIVQGLVDKIKEIWPESFNDFLGGVGSAVAKVGNVAGFAEGGVVPGPVGQPRAAVVHGGEAIFPPHALQQLAMGPAALAPALPPPAPVFAAGAGRSVTVGDINITIQVGSGAQADEIADTISRTLRDQIEDLVADADGPIAR